MLQQKMAEWREGLLIILRDAGVWLLSKGGWDFAHTNDWEIYITRTGHDPKQNLTCYRYRHEEDGKLKMTPVCGRVV